MGNCLGGDGISSEEAKRDRELMAEMAKQADAEKSKIKLLLLGAGESGKSTIFKQMKLLYGAPQSERERLEIKPVIHQNMTNTFKVVLAETYRRKEDDRAFSELVGPQAELQTIMEMDEETELTPELGVAIQKLWADEYVQKTWNMRSEYQVVESIAQFFSQTERICANDYVPTPQDMLLARVRTSGIVTERYEIEGNIFEMYDVGGQRNERKKWIHCFDNVTAVIFVAAISEYNQKLFEDSNTNRMVEALDLYEDVAKNRYFEKASMLLFLNKKDLFAQKIEEVPISDTFEDYTGGSDYNAGCKYFVERFRALMPKSDKKMFYYHITCATDTSNVQKVWSACKEVILQQNLRECGLI